MGNGFYFVACIPNRHDKMEKTDYIQLFDKFLQKQATQEEVQTLIQWLKSEGSFQDWAEEEWDMASSTMDARLQQKLLGQIKEKIGLETQQAPLKGINIVHFIYGLPV